MWKTTRDPLVLFETRAVETMLVEEPSLRRIDAEIDAAVEAAVDAAERAPFPDLASVLTDVYVGE
jgi:pyruvate dehydrogenase E1 component alpha subunit